MKKGKNHFSINYLWIDIVCPVNLNLKSIIIEKLC